MSNPGDPTPASAAPDLDVVSSNVKLAAYLAGQLPGVTQAMMSAAYSAAIAYAHAARPAIVAQLYHEKAIVEGKGSLLINFVPGPRT